MSIKDYMVMNGSVIAEEVQEKENKIEGIDIPDSAEESLGKSFRVVACGLFGETYSDFPSGTTHKYILREGDIVVLSKYFNSSPLTVDGKTYQIFYEKDVIAIKRNK